ncbi:hypothetical protein A1O1_03757 [Capronia coronata CBS 617.96]|uniref:Uncharacterized protein n=1 Tax=Capronia coronata CBS 617.96 TaxID=1182541 RepID=W9YDN2_9EURO|nr:uncharacterized protein A1O1_03757 [Capronia coronata CBS 617.96]EXJ90653.1 hypothetical protein A1O1_03757 [Capronia coronata CBS 617.96]
MVEIPILVSTPGQHTVELAQPAEYPFAQSSQTTGQQADQQPSVATNVFVAAEATSPAMVSDTTQTNPEEEGSRHTSPKRQSPAHSRSQSRARTSPRTWAEAIRQRLASPHSHFHSPVSVDASGRTLLSPGNEPVLRSTTPAADLYKGQDESNFGMTFDHHHSVNHFLKASKPQTCAYSYEDQKHRMLMDWVERRR